MPDPLRNLWLAHDGPAPPADLGTARWGAGARRRLARGADAALAEARLRACLGALARLRRFGASGVAEAVGRLCESALSYRRAALSRAR
ncbi:MAG: hypothetical protein JNM29_11360 [Candidatus Odyssella sp.]|nr:hypothetical protein [Candidatus Odyssella sp.]